MPEYVTDRDLKKIRYWRSDDLINLMVFVESVWAYPGWGFMRSYEEKKEVLHLHTGGWSGNEEIISALQDNTIFWALCWESSRRGGHYLFKVNQE